MSTCPICNKEFDLRASGSFASHMQTVHPSYWKRSRRLRQAATITMLISIMFTVLLIVVFYTADVVGFSMMGMAALFLAFSSSFSLRERGLARRYKKKTEKGKSEFSKAKRRTQRERSG